MQNKQYKTSQIKEYYSSNRHTWNEFYPSERHIIGYVIKKAKITLRAFFGLKKLLGFYRKPKIYVFL